ncbi:DUF2474 family protein [Roseospira marina]|uniref:DUF2474 family protein n=1 Tax=Roseospira marina TaxID=140057 RepID=A0A5M6IFW9_9PROT|nr:DUF2474 family protein [Roseospira marina]KAA5607201.1 DUF2474 family protein [Roseospira marina]MBB4312649.1 hypothetical protein [Roseospira marina]MBB5085335.1 hypothetical protein [Roseospira marina]
MAERQRSPGPLWRRLAWFGGLWAAGVLTLTVVAGGLRALVAALS